MGRRRSTIAAAPLVVFLAAAVVVVGGGGVRMSATNGPDRFRPGTTGPVPSPPSSAAAPNGHGRVLGITLDDLTDLDGITAMLAHLPRRATVRVVLDADRRPESYVRPVAELHKHADVMTELVDSDDVVGLSVAAYRDRAVRFVDALGDDVDIWEVGNEVNGEWLGSSAEVTAKVRAAHDVVASRHGRTAVTLFANEGCAEQADHELLRWTHDHVGDLGTDYDWVLVSYYEDECDGRRPTDWTPTFDALHALFPGASLGFGEVGMREAATPSTTGRSQDVLSHYYSLQVRAPGYIGGGFWWYGSEDLVPTTKPLFATLVRSTSGWR